MRTLPLVQVDAFTAEPFRGNPAAVCFLDGLLDDAVLQEIAAEMNLSETAFLLSLGDGTWSLRWCTPRVEISLCGHATLAATHAILGRGLLRPGEAATFVTRSGKLEGRVLRSGWIELDFPSQPANACDTPAGLEAALGAPVVSAAHNGVDLLVELADPAKLRALRPNLEALEAFDVRGVIVTSVSDLEGCDFLSRFFAPRVGVPEDPVTGSAHTCLGPFWSARLGRTTVTGYQASRRGGTVQVEMRGDRVALRGQAVTVLEGTLRVRA